MSTVDQSTQEVIDEIVRMSHGDIDRVRELVDLHPGLVNARASWNEAPIEAAAHCGQQEIAELLLSAGADLDICTAAMLGDTGRVSDFLQQNPGLAHATGAHGIPVLFFAAMGGHIGIAELLWRHGASVNAGEGGNMALHAPPLLAGRRWLNGSSQTAQRSTSLATMARRRWPWLSIEVITTLLSYCANTEVKIRVDRSTDHRPTG